MRIKEPFAKERLSQINEYKKKYFIVSEGTATEPEYFEKINQYAIKENITIINILRDYAKQGYSNPTHIIKLLQTFIDNSNSEIKVGELKNKLSNWKYQKNIDIDLDTIFNKLKEIYESDDCYISIDNFENLFMKLFKNNIYEELMNNFFKYFVTQNVTYSPNVDSLNIVIDRDKDSFTEEQYDKVVDFCSKNNVNLYISNPNFELWLYMHFDEFDNENVCDLFENRKINSSGRRYIEKRLRDICNYRKNNIRFDKLRPGIKNAIKREKKFSEDIYDLKNQLGTNVGKLVSDIIKE